MFTRLRKWSNARQVGRDTSNLYDLWLGVTRGLICTFAVGALIALSAPSRQLMYPGWLFGSIAGGLLGWYLVSRSYQRGRYTSPRFWGSPLGSLLIVIISLAF